MFLIYEVLACRFRFRSEFHSFGMNPRLDNDAGYCSEPFWMGGLISERRKSSNLHEERRR